MNLIKLKLQGPSLTLAPSELGSGGVGCLPVLYRALLVSNLTAPPSQLPLGQAVKSGHGHIWGLAKGKLQWGHN